MERIVLAFFIAFSLAGSAFAAAPRPPASRDELTFSYAPVVKKTAPAVVNIYATRKLRQAASPYGDDPLYRRFFGPGPGAPRERVQNALGSGVIVRPEGIVVTNNHVIENADAVKVALADRREFEADILLKDERSDLAVLRIRGSNESFPAVPIGDSDSLEVGDIVLALGNPFGIGQTVTSGIVSGLARTQVGVTDYQFFIQTDAAINPGNSGGALVDMAGRLIGVNTAIYSRSGGSNGIGFAIPSNMVHLVVDSALSGGIKRPWLGARLQDVTPEIADSLKLPRPSGTLIAELADSGTAKESGLQTGDVILAVDGQEVLDSNGFGYRFATRKLGAMASLTVLRQGRQIIVPVAVRTPPETTPRDERTIAGRTPLTGATVVNLSPATAEELGLEPHFKGVAVARLDNRSAARNLGLRRGDIVLAVNDQKISTTRDLERALNARQRYWQLTIQRGEEVVNVMVGG